MENIPFKAGSAIPESNAFVEDQHKVWAQGIIAELGLPHVLERCSWATTEDLLAKMHSHARAELLMSEPGEWSVATIPMTIKDESDEDELIVLWSTRATDDIETTADVLTPIELEEELNAIKANEL